MGVKKTAISFPNSPTGLICNLGQYRSPFFPLLSMLVVSNQTIGSLKQGLFPTMCMLTLPITTKCWSSLRLLGAVALQIIKNNTSNFYLVLHTSTIPLQQVLAENYIIVHWLVSCKIKLEHTHLLCRKWWALSPQCQPRCSEFVTFLALV